MSSISFNRRIELENFDDGGFASGPRRVSIGLPTDYHETNDRYPVMYFSDGGLILSKSGWETMEADLAHDKLVDEGLIDPAIIVCIWNTSHSGRIKDLTPTEDSGDPDMIDIGGGLEGYCRFISERLKPYVDNHYRTKTEPETTGIAGASLGGLAALLMGYTHPETFGMAGCMSSALQWDRGYVFNVIANNKGGKKPVRIWLDGGGAEYEVWIDAARAYTLLEERGWLPGDDLAAYFDYAAEHDVAGQRGRVREMLHFLLCKEAPQMESYRLVSARDPSAVAIDIGSACPGIVGAEAWYAGGLRLTVPRPGITVEDTSVVASDIDDPILFHATACGETTLISHYQGHTASLRVIVGQ